MDGLGREFNYRQIADAGYIRLDNADAVSFFCYLTGGVADTYTVQEAKDAAGTGAQNLVKIDHYYTCTGDGSDAWVKRTQTAAAAITTTTATTQAAACFSVSANSLSDTYKYLKCTSTGAGLVSAVQHD